MTPNAARAATLVRALHAALAGDITTVRELCTDDVKAWAPALSVGSLAELIAEGQPAPGIDPMDAAALVIAASDGLQIQWLLDPDTVDVGRSLAILDRLLPPRTTRPDAV